MNRRQALRLIGSAATALPRSAAQPERYRPAWESIDSRPIPTWYSDAKFGIFIHWGVYSVPAYAAVGVKGENPYAEWYWNSLTEGRKTSAAGHGAMTRDFHNRVYGSAFPYFNFAPMFRAELFDPDHWADVFQQSGAKYVALTSKHHEGFTLWRSAEANRTWGRPWNSVDIGPKRDLLAALSEAGRRKGLRMGIYYSMYEWYNPLWLADKKRYVSEHLFPQFKDVVTHAKPSIIFSDGEWELPGAEWRSPELLAWLYNESPVANEVVVNDRWGKDTRHKHGGYYTTEYTAGMQSATHAWEENRGMGYSYGYNRMETLKDYRTGRELVLMLVDIVSRGGNLLLDIGPTADGRIPVEMEDRLNYIGNWLRFNGEAIYGTKAWHTTRQWSAGQQPKMEEKEFMGEYNIQKMVDAPPAGFARVDAFFTAKGETVYAIVPRWPDNGLVLDGILASSGAKITMLETGDDLKWMMEGNRVRLEIPETIRSKMPFRDAYVVKMAGVSSGQNF